MATLLNEWTGEEVQAVV